MPCHVDPINPSLEKKEISLIVRVVRGRISVTDVGGDFNGKYPTVPKLLADAKSRYKDFHYKVHGTTMVFVTPCPKGC